jgi:hypothetical protein
VEPRDVLVRRDDGSPYGLRLRACTAADVDVFTNAWSPVLDRGPSAWLDRGWIWDRLSAPDQLAFKVSPEWVVLADEIEPGAQRDLLGVMVTTGPIAPEDASLDAALVGNASALWVEYLAAAPSIRRDCPEGDRRSTNLNRVGARLMLAAIERSWDLGCEGRVGLHAEGDIAELVYEAWDMERLEDAPHPAGGVFPIFWGSADWAKQFAEKRRVPR